MWAGMGTGRWDMSGQHVWTHKTLSCSWGSSLPRPGTFPSAPHPSGTYSSPTCQAPSWICHFTPPSYWEGESWPAWARPPTSLQGGACLFQASLLPDGFSIFLLSELRASISCFDKERKRQLLFPLSHEGSQAN